MNVYRMKYAQARKKRQEEVEKIRMEEQQRKQQVKKTSFPLDGFLMMG